MEKPAIAHPSAGNLLHSYKREFMEWTCVIGLSKDTASIRGRGLDNFIRWCDERGLNRPQDITRPILQRYQRHLFHYRKADGNPLCYVGSCGNASAPPSEVAYIQVKVEGFTTTYFARVVGRDTLPVKAQSFVGKCNPSTGVYR